MKLKTHRRRLSFAVIFIFGLVLLAHIQVPAQSQNFSKVPSHTIEIVSQPDSPLALTAKGSEKADYGLIKLNVNIKNIGEKTVKAFSLSRNAFQPTALSLITFFSPLNSGQTIEAFDHEAVVNLKEGSKVYFLIDYVLFTDGTSWGKNSRNESELISGFYNGQLEALSEIKKLVISKNELAISKLLQQENIQFERSSLDKTKSDNWRTGFEVGYKNIIFELSPQYQKHGLSALLINPDEFNDLVRPNTVAH